MLYLIILLKIILATEQEAWLVTCEYPFIVSIEGSLQLHPAGMITCSIYFWQTPISNGCIWLSKAYPQIVPGWWVQLYQILKANF